MFDSCWHLSYLRDGLEVHFAEHYDDVFDVVSLCLGVARLATWAANASVNSVIVFLVAVFWCAWCSRHSARIAI